MAPRTLGLLPPAHPQLAEPPAGTSLRRPGPRRLHDHGGGDRVHRALRQALAGTRPHRHERHVGTAHRRRLPRDDQPGRDRLPGGGRRERRLQPAGGAAAQRGGAAGRRAADAVRLPRTRAAPRRRRARRGSVGDRRATGRRAAQVGPAGDPLGGGARAAAAHLPRARRAVVDGRLGGVGPEVRRGRRPHPGPAAALAPARGDARAHDPRPQRAHLPGGRAGGPMGGRARRARAVLRRPA